LAWTIEYTDVARTQLRKLDKAAARRILDYNGPTYCFARGRTKPGKGLAWTLGRVLALSGGRLPHYLRSSRRDVARLGGADRKSKRCLPIEANRMLFCSSFPSGDRKSTPILTENETYSCGPFSPPSGGARGRRVASRIMVRSWSENMPLKRSELMTASRWSGGIARKSRTAVITMR
jgi:hypothetical protein